MANGRKPYLSGPHVGSTPPKSLRDKNPFRTIEKGLFSPLPAGLGAIHFPLRLCLLASCLCVHSSTAVNKNPDSGIIFSVSVRWHEKKEDDSSNPPWEGGLFIKEFVKSPEGELKQHVAAPWRPSWK